MIFESANGRFEPLDCPFCGTENIKFGASICRGCQADIRYENLQREAAIINAVMPLVIAAVAGVLVAGIVMKVVAELPFILTAVIFIAVSFGVYFGARRAMRNRADRDWSSNPTKVRFLRGGKSMTITGIILPLDL